MDQLPRLGKRELICLLLFTCNYVVFVWRSFLFLWMLGMDYVILLWHSLNLPYNYFTGVFSSFFFALKHRLRVLVRTASIHILAKKRYKNFHLKIIIFTAVKNCCMLHERVFVMQQMLCGNQTLCFLFCICIRKFVN